MILENLNHDEKEILYNTVPAIGLLIASADGTIDTEEVTWASRLVEVRSFSGDKLLRPFYETIEQSYDERLKAMSSALTGDKAATTAALSAVIASANAPLSKLEHKEAKHLYESFVGYAESVAKASGGILGFGSIGSDEAKLISLPMLDKIS